MIVCVCRRVSDRDIQHAVHRGCGSFEDLQMELGVATCCGRCADCARSVLHTVQSRPAHGASAAVMAPALALA